MADVKWIKLSVGLPDNKKIKQIRRLPEGDTIALMWVFLMCLAGEVNDDGAVYFTPEIPYTDEMLSDQFNIDINTVRLALTTFQRFGMIEIIDDFIHLDAWEKWQSVDSLANIREQTRKRVAKHRALKKLEAGNVTGNVTVTPSNAIEEDKEIDKEKEKEGEKDREIENTAPSASASAKPTRHKYGQYKNVLLSDEDMEKLKTEFPADWQDRIERLSEYIESSGKKYKNHLATIRSWARKDKKGGSGNGKRSGNTGSNTEGCDYGEFL